MSRTRIQVRPGLAISIPADIAVGGKPSSSLIVVSVRVTPVVMSYAPSVPPSAYVSASCAVSRVNSGTSLWYARSSRSTSVRSALLPRVVPGNGASAWMDSTVAAASVVRAPGARREAPPDEHPGRVRQPERIHADLAELRGGEAAAGEVVDRLHEALALDDEHHLPVRRDADALLAELRRDGVLHEHRSQHRARGRRRGRFGGA